MSVLFRLCVRSRHTQRGVVTVYLAAGQVDAVVLAFMRKEAAIVFFRYARSRLWTRTECGETEPLDTLFCL